MTISSIYTSVGIIAILIGSLTSGGTALGTRTPETKRLPASNRDKRAFYFFAGRCGRI